MMVQRLLLWKQEQEKKECMSRNIEHLETMKAKDYWTTEDFTDIDAAITKGKTLY